MIPAFAGEGTSRNRWEYFGNGSAPWECGFAWRPPSHLAAVGEARGVPEHLLRPLGVKTRPTAPLPPGYCRTVGLGQAGQVWARCPGQAGGQGAPRAASSLGDPRDPGPVAWLSPDPGGALGGIGAQRPPVGLGGAAGQRPCGVLAWGRALAVRRRAAPWERGVAFSGAQRAGRRGRGF